MSSEIVTRRFRPTDAEPLIALWQQVLPSPQPWNEPRTALLRKLNRHDDLVFVAEQNGAVVGAVVAGYDGMRGWIYGLAVSPELRRSGIGRNLLDEAESALIALGCPKVNLQVRSTNSEVVEFYRRCGYDLEDRASLGKSLDSGLRSPSDPVPTIQVTNQISLSQISLDDKPAYLRHLNETHEFRLHTSSMPYPYTDFDADQWLAKAVSETLATDRNRNWAIRNESGELIGSIGLMGITAKEKAEVGYWLAKPFWGQGIMTRVVRSLCNFAFDEYRLYRIHGRVFAGNPKSANVLKKVGFVLEGTQRNHFFRDGEPEDVLLFGLLQEETR